jgi:hypothetical protein
MRKAPAGIDNDRNTTYISDSASKMATPSAISEISTGGEDTVGNDPINSTMALYRASSSSDAIVVSK